ncbi:low affinity immunoglobulin epsilon Fc receptor-like [Strongylocentrotus purpuratus]|uniref:C-type lectin domain-containing protein n=1 Tax=Strongylocentrotus purpuratus TaxID=7668 RepID=A0A7M7GJ16_STRPU|nr:low affinity immunoglobulin epsilon Fc receptor-like [Strongylocentrotus purpuratus]|eukprot:XP_003729530.1 PREDICTED: low affinity immunoglobulin epsilon Fc receptor-like [Strongylocentrotus purpuratus]
MKFASEETVFVTIAIAAIVSLQGVTSQTSSSEWHRLDDAVYLVDGITRVRYDEAQSLCQDLYGANLARVDSDKIQDFLTTFISPPLEDTRCFSIGCDDSEVEGQFRWLDGTPVIYDGWARRQPDNNGPGDQDCACLWSSTVNYRHGRWDDAVCSLDRYLICQKGIYNFRLTIPRPNPGFANVYCAVDVDIQGEALSPDDVRVSIG